MRVNVRHCYGSDQGIQWECTLTINGSIHILCCKTLLNTFFPVTISTILAILEPTLNREGSAALTLIPFIQMNHRSRLLLSSFHFLSLHIYIHIISLPHPSVTPILLVKITSIACTSLPQSI